MSDSTGLKQEAFFVTNQEFANRKKIIRQDRWNTDIKTCFIISKDFNFEVLNLSTFGCACLVKQEHFFILNNLLSSAETLQFKLIYNKIETQEILLKVVRLDDSEKNTLFAGFEVVGAPINVDRCKAISESISLLKKQGEHIDLLSQIPVPLKAAVFELKECLAILKNQLVTLENNSPQDDAKANEEYRLTIAESISDYLGEFLPAIYKQIPPMLEKLNPQQKKLSVEFIRNQLAPLVYGAPFANRAFYKPRGYAGDYEMMNHLYRNELVGKTLFDQTMHKYFIDEPAGVAVKNRGHYLYQKIKGLIETNPNKPLKILSVASGPAMEVQLLLQNCPHLFGKNIEFTFIDQDEESLKHAQKQIGSLERFKNSGFKFLYKNLAIKNIIIQGLPSGDFDMIYSAGLFDYFTDPVAQTAAKQMSLSLGPSGTLIIGNFSKDNPCVPFMEYILDWILIYRSSEEMTKLFKDLGSVTIEQEDLGVNLFAVIKK